MAGGTTKLFCRIVYSVSNEKRAWVHGWSRSRSRHTIRAQQSVSLMAPMDHHTVAAVSITGTFLDVLGSLYLAYDLLGGQRGPLRLLTRAVTYSVVFGIGYGLGLGLVFAGLWNCDRDNTNDRIQPGSSWARSLLVAVGRSVFRDPRIWLRSGTISDFGLAIRDRICPSHHDRPNIRLLCLTKIPLQRFPRNVTLLRCVQNLPQYQCQGRVYQWMSYARFRGRSLPLGESGGM